MGTWSPFNPSKSQSQLYQKMCTASTAEKNAPCTSSEQTGFAQKSWEGVEGSSDLNFWRRTVLSLPPSMGTAAGPVIWFSENYRFWHPKIGWECWIYLLFVHIQIYIRFYPASLQRKFWKYKLMKALQNKQFSYHYLFPATVSLSCFLKKNGHLRSQILQKNASCGLLDFHYFPAAHLHGFIFRLRAQIMQSVTLHP